MGEKLKIFDISENELKELYTKYSTDFLGSSQSQNVKRDIANLAHNELVRRSSNEFAKKSNRLSNYVLALSIIAIILSGIGIVFASIDYRGDQKWQNDQIDLLQKLNEKLNTKNQTIKERNNLLETQLNSLNKKINSVEKKLDKKVK
ncbi:hypothetical protein J8L88_16745 [Aquimarina sp. MMG015]|uniref:hypothetical protein n=1 Tax=Aquimarina sp. MMG015 TaxID=2822689 RepID=UPI001B3A5513|nr:hypothetical protein [Aquimarina sp. MMG015]MBQ4804511.1 hypothetical protein [Aquimarina sp. MMG015]